MSKELHVSLIFSDVVAFKPKSVIRSYFGFNFCYKLNFR